MKILLVHCHYRLPGGEDAVFAAERALLERRGHQVIVYERSNEEAAHGLPKALLPLHAVWNHAAARDIKHIIKTQNIDAVHIHNTLLLLSPAVVRAAKSTGVPVVQTLHNFRLFCPNGILLRDGRVCEDCPRHGLSCAIRHRCYRGSLAQTLVVAAAYGLHRRLGTWRGVTMVALTEFDRQKLLEFNRQYPMFDADRLMLKPNPVCVPSGPVNPWGDRKNQMLFAGRLEELKGLRTVHGSLAACWAMPPPRCWWQGKAPSADWARAQKLAQRAVLWASSPARELHRPHGRKPRRCRRQPLLRELRPCPRRGPRFGHPGAGQRFGQCGCVGAARALTASVSPPATPTLWPVPCAPLDNMQL